MSKTVIVDFGAGNLFSIARAVEHCGGDPEITGEPDGIANADRLILPGVGAFGNGMAALEAANLTDPLRAFAETGRPMLGICLGMQMMMEESEEFGSHSGLSLFPGNVAAIPAIDTSGAAQKVPHIGWNALQEPAAGRWQDSLLADTPEGETVYFVHSFAAKPENPDHILASCYFGGHQLTAAISRDGITGCQFHPERSGEAGLGIIRRFLA